MGKILKPLAVIAAVAVNVIPGVGQALSGGIIGALGGSFAAATVASIAVPALLAATTIAGLSALAPGGRGAASSLVPFDPKAINPDPAALRKYLLGRGLFAMDLRYFEASGTNQEYVDYVFCLAAHRSHSVDEIWIDKDLAWTSGGGVQGKYVGYLWIEVILEAGAGAFHTVNGGATWGAAQRLTGCTTMKVRVKRSDNSRTSQSPFGTGIGGQWRVIGNGMPVYDPARDSTVPGGSGPQRANDCSTWAWEVSGVERGRNPALQLLSILLGWKINGVGSVGFGYPPDTFNLAGWAQAAARCDEAVALAGGGSQRRYETGGSFTDGDGPLAVISKYEDAVNGEFTDHGGQFNLRVAVNDLTPTFTLTDDDFVAGYEWRPEPDLGEQFTVVRARYTQPASPTLFDLLDVPEVTIPRTSLAPRPLTLDLGLVQDQRRAQRILKQVAQRQLIRGEFSTVVGIRGWRLRRNQVGVINSASRGWAGQLVRVREATFNQNGTVAITFREEAASIYAWAAEESPVVTPPTPTVFDTRAAASWLLAGIEAGANLTAPNGANRVPYSRMERDSGWTGATNSPSGVTGLVYFSFEGRRAVVSQATASAAGQALVVMPAPGDDPLIKVEPNERLSISFRAGAINATQWQMSFRYRRADGSINEVFVASGTTFNWTVELQNIFFVVPSDARLGMPKLYVFSAAAGPYECLISEPMMAGAASGQTTHPAFTPGPNASNGADVTRDTLPVLQRGAWSSASAAYALGDIVTRDGSSYTCIIAHSSSAGNGPPGSNWALLANAGAQGATGVSAPPIKALGTGGAAQFDPIRLTAGQTLTVDAALFLNTGGVAGTCSMQVQWSVNGANSWTTMTNGSASDNQPTTEPVELAVPNATFTNTSGQTQLYDVRVTSTRQSRTVNQPLSYMRVV